MLSLCDQNLVFVIDEKGTLIGIQVNVVTPNLGATGWCVTVTALDANLHIVILEGHQWKTLGPVFTEEEWNHVVITAMVRLLVIGCDGARSLRRRITEKGVVYTLDEKGVELRHLLTTDPQAEFSRTRRIRGEQAVRVGLDIGDVSILDPDVTHEVTLRTDRNGNLVIGTEGTDVIHTLGLHCEVSMAFIVLSKKRNLGISSDEYILGTYRHKLY